MITRTTLPCLAALLTFAFAANLHGASTLKFEYSQYSATEDTPSVLVAVLRAGDLTGPASVEVASYDITATAGADYEATSLTVEFADGEEVQTFRVPLLNDGTEEPDERFRLMLENPSEGSQLGAPNFAVVTLKDNDPGVQFPYQHFWGYERDGQSVVTVERGNDVDLSAFTVDYATSDVTALAGQDYTAVSGTLEFAEGEMTKTILIPIADDAEVESREELQIALLDSTGPGGLGENVTATLLLHDTTGHEPTRFGEAQLVAPEGGDPARIEVPVMGRHGGDNALRYELFCLESSGDFEAWRPETWLAFASPELPAAFRQALSGTDRLFFRLRNPPLVAAWPPPESPNGVFATRDAAVGYTQRWITDPTRRNRYGISDNGTFRVSIWYPASPALGPTPKRFVSPETTRFWLENWDYPLGLPGPDTVTYSFEDSAFRAGDSQHPIVLYSHEGAPFGPDGAGAWNRAEFLASQGYVVMAPDHYDCFETRLADGSFYGTARIPARTAAGFQDRMQDFRVLLDVLAEWQESDPTLAGRLDLNHMAAMGNQWGAGVAGELCRSVEACRAGVLFVVSDDQCWTGADTLRAEGPGKPTMFIQWEGPPAKDVYSQMEDEAVWFQLAGSYWNSLYTWYAWDNVLFGRPSEQTLIDHEITQTINAYVGSFFDAKVRGNSDNVLWQAPSPEHPRVIYYERK